MMIALVLLAAQAAPPAQEKRTDFLRRVYEKDRAGFGDACRLVVGLAKDAPGEGDATREAAGLGLVDPAWGIESASPVDKGTVAYMLVKALGIKGGLTMSVFGPSRRYAFRELVFLRIMKGGTPGELITGRELIDVLSAAEIYKTAGSLDADRK
jgi:hypothetical protein